MMLLGLDCTKFGKYAFGYYGTRFGWYAVWMVRSLDRLVRGLDGTQFGWYAVWIVRSLDGTHFG